MRNYQPIWTAEESLRMILDDWLRRKPQGFRELMLSVGSATFEPLIAQITQETIERWKVSGTPRAPAELMTETKLVTGLIPLDSGMVTFKEDGSFAKFIRHRTTAGSM